MRPINVLVFPCGSELGLELADALELSVHVKLFGASSKNDYGSIRYSNYHKLPMISDPGFNDALGRFIKDLDIDLIFATHDSVLVYIAKYIRNWSVSLVNGDFNTVGLARSKSATYNFFSNFDWCPKVYQSTNQIDFWPVVLKPDEGQGGKGVFVAESFNEAQSLIEKHKDLVICEHLPGQELSVDCFTDYKGRLIFIGPRTRDRVFGGISLSTISYDADALILEIAKTINKSLKFRGAWFFQVKADANGKWKLLEISCRLSSSSVAYRAKGVNLALMAVHDYLERDVLPLDNIFVKGVERRLKSRAVMNYSFDTVYIDLDDTLVFDGIAHPQAMSFLYAMLAKGKRLILVTRHQGSVEEYLAKASIARSLFSEVFHLTEGQAKSSVIKGSAIFIDNHFPERLDVATVCNIPVFDVDALELLY